MGIRKKKQVYKEKIDMYDMMLANLVAGEDVIEPEGFLDISKINIGYSELSSETMIAKYFMVTKLPDWLSTNFMDKVRSRCIRRGVRVDFYIYGQPHRIKWESAEMRNKMSIWKNYAENTESEPDVFEYRSKRNEAMAKDRIIESTRYLNVAELDQKRTTMKVSIIIKITAKRDKESIYELRDAIKSFKTLCATSEIKIKELKINMIDWLQYLGLFSLKPIREVAVKVGKSLLTDDILANFNGYKQGRVGTDGTPLGIDVLSKVPVFKKFKEDPDAAENWIISAGTGGGKSYFVKTLLTYLLADGFVVTVLDYEGDEYTNMANYIKAGNPDDVKVISMGKGSTIYFDPMEIAMLTGDPDVDDDLKEQAINYTLAIFRVISCGTNGMMNQSEEKLVSTAIKRVYEAAGLTENKNTWHRSKGLRLKMVYNELKDMMESKEFADDTTGNIKHNALVRIVENASTYFEEGEAKAGTFKNPMSVNELLKAKFIVFSFGMKGESSSQSDPVVLALKQLSVASVSIQISNYCKYVRRCFNVKVWEEYQRWGEVAGSAELISNCITGGRKRGDVNLIITNDLEAMLDESNHINKRLSANIQSFAIGAIKDSDIRHKFCQKFNLLELEPSLDLIAKARYTVKADSKSKDGGSGNRYRHSFCIALDNGKRAITKVMLPAELRNSQIFKTGVDIEKASKVGE